MAEMELATLICGEIAGTLRQDEHGLCSFVYAPTYRGAPLSLTMPLSNRTYGHNIVRPFLFGLLPDSQEQRRAIAAEYDVASNNPVALLCHIGLDCAGAVQFCRTDQLGAARGRSRHTARLPILKSLTSSKQFAMTKERHGWAPTKAGPWAATKANLH